MKINITPELRKQIKAAIEADRNAKWDALASMSIYYASIDDIIAARAAYEKADEQSKAASKLIAGAEADLNVTTGTLTWGELPDHRPVSQSTGNWRGGFAFRVPSRSGGRDHEIVAHGYDANFKSSCNCASGNFNGTCWAQQEVAKDQERSIYRVTSTAQFEDFGKRRESYDD